MLTKKQYSSESQDGQQRRYRCTDSWQRLAQLPRLLLLSTLAALIAVPAPAWAVETDPITAFVNASQAPANTSGNDGAMSRFQALTNRASELAMQAVSMLGIHYQRGGNTPESGLDCSGLVRYVFKEAWGTILPRTAEEISRVGKQVDNPDMQPGDLVFYNTLKRGFSHVGIYLGDNKFIHSPSAGGQVRIESMDLSYWKQRFNGARRIEQPAQR
jgi:cell wall-associated NlpC family hydrolase